jgi:transcriptional regulator with XRE-family HTH domain
VLKDIYREVGESIRARRLQRGMTLEDLAEASSLHASFIGQIERNTKKASLKTIAILAEALGVLPARLFASPTSKAASAGRLDPLLSSMKGAHRALMLDVLRRLAKGLRELDR